MTAQSEVARLEKKFADALAPFWPVIDGKVYPGEAASALKSGAGAEIDVMIGTTREEMAAFYCIDDEIEKADQAAIEGVFASVFPTGHRRYYDEIRRMRASRTNAALLGDLMSDAMFRMGSLRMAEWRADQGRPVYVYQFDWQSPAGFEACHCLEIPFVFNNFTNWTDSPDAQGRASPPRQRELQRRCTGPGSRLRGTDARSPGLAQLAPVPPRGPHDDAFR